VKSRAYLKFLFAFISVALVALSACTDGKSVKRNIDRTLIESNLADSIEPRIVRPGTTVQLRGSQVDRSMSAKINGVELPLRQDGKDLASAVIPAGGQTGVNSLN
jgi:hypothetical protein